MKQEKKGFTLIELMVVIVIIGILAAIAIPKLFGMTAKAKAQEVPGAAGTWSKLQAAYVMEKSELGSNTSISYKHPGQTQYAPTFINNGFTYGSTGGAWTAGIGVKLGDDCPSGTNWTVTYDASNGVTASVNDLCKALTPNFVNLK